MARYLSSRSKQSRRAGEKIFDSPKFNLAKRNYPPGQHGPKGTPRSSDFGIKLREKQKAKHTYRVMEKQFSNYFKEAKRQTGNTGENLLRLLETRLDNVVYRLGLAESRDAARQLISHKHITLMGKIVSIPSYQVKAKDDISIVTTYRDKAPVRDLSKTLAKHKTLDWLEVNAKEVTGTIKHQPTKDDLELGIDTQLIVEYYSR
jgi:small subunit ribosomal protein S4